MEISSVCFIEKLSLTFFAHSDVRGYENITFFLFAFDYLKAVKRRFVAWAEIISIITERSGGRLSRAFFSSSTAFFTALCVVSQHKSLCLPQCRKVQGLTLHANKRSEAHALNDTINTNHLSFHQISSLTVSFISSSASLLRTSISTSSNSSPS